MSTCSGGFTKLGTGNLYFTGRNTFAGAHHVTEGLVYIDGSQTRPVFVDANGMLHSVGVINNTVSIGGTLYPGHSPGTLTVKGNVIQTAGSTFNTDLAGAVAGTYGQLVVSGTGQTYTAGGTLTPNLYGGYQPVIGDSYRFVTAQGGISDQYAVLTAGVGRRGRISIFSTTGMTLPYTLHPADNSFFSHPFGWFFWG